MNNSLRVMDQVLIIGAEYMSETGCTVRQLAEYLNTLIQKQCSSESISKTSVHYFLTVKLPKIDWFLYEKVRGVLNRNKEEAPSRGGNALQMKLRKMKQAG